jgi:hypothetical protein
MSLDLGAVGRGRRAVGRWRTVVRWVRRGGHDHERRGDDPDSRANDGAGQTEYWRANDRDPMPSTVVPASSVPATAMATIPIPRICRYRWNHQHYDERKSQRYSSHAQILTSLNATLHKELRLPRAPPLADLATSGPTATRVQPSSPCPSTANYAFCPTIVRPW